jgi:integrase
MKVKNHNLNDFQLPLTDEVINILLEQKEFLTLYTELREYIFIGTDNINPINRESPNQALMRMGFTANKKQSLHSFRGTFRTIVEEKQPEHQVSEKIMESILDHNKDSKVELAYKNKVNYFEQQKPLLNWWSNYILSLKD